MAAMLSPAPLAGMLVLGWCIIMSLVGTYATEVLSILATEKVKSVKRSHTIIEFVAVWSV